MRIAIATLIALAGLASADPKPPPEIADMLKSMGGTWKCEGTALGLDGKQEKVKMTSTSRSDLDGFWAHDSLAGGKLKLESFTTWDSQSKKWRRVILTNDGGQMVGTAEPMKDMKIDYSFDTAGALGTGLFKEHLDASDLKRGAHVWGEQSLDKGKTWTPVYDLICRR
jgi:hypothetical protein